MRLSIIDTLIALGMKSSLPNLVQGGSPEILSVLLDGRVIGVIAAHLVEKAVSHLRKLKLSGGSEVGHLQKTFACQISLVDCDFNE